MHFFSINPSLYQMFVLGNDLQKYHYQSLWLRKNDSEK